MEREPDLLDRQVEGKRGTLVDAVFGVHAEDAAFGAHEVAGAAVLDHHALGATRGTRRVDDVAKVARAHADRVALQACGALGVDRGTVGVDADDRAAEGGVTPRQVRGRHERPGAGVLEDVGHAVRRVFRVERHVGRAGLEDAEERRIGVRGPREQQGDERPALHTPRAEMAREPVRAALEVHVRRPLAAEDDGAGAGPRIGLRLEDLMEDLGALCSRSSTSRGRRCRGSGARRRLGSRVQTLPHGISSLPSSRVGDLRRLPES